MLKLKSNSAVLDFLYARAGVLLEFQSGAHPTSVLPVQGGSIIQNILMRTSALAYRTSFTPSVRKSATPPLHT